MKTLKRLAALALLTSALTVAAVAVELQLTALVTGAVTVLSGTVVLVLIHRQGRQGRLRFEHVPLYLTQTDHPRGRRTVALVDCDGSDGCVALVRTELGGTLSDQEVHLTATQAEQMRDGLNLILHQAHR